MGSLADVRFDRGLPRGRAHMSAEAVAAAQRTRLLRAIVGAAAERGYANVRIADVVDRARVSRATFYAQFASKEACFLAAHADALDTIVAELRTQIAAASDPLHQLSGGIDAYFALAEREPEFARCMLIELPAIGPAGLAARVDAHRRIAGLFATWHEAARALDGPSRDWPEVPRGRYAAAVGTVHDLLFDLVADSHHPRERPPVQEALDAVLALLEIPGSATGASVEPRR